MKLIDKSDCRSSFIDSTSFLHYLPAAKTGNISGETKDTEENFFTADLPERLRKDMWQLDGSQVLQVIAGQGRAFCLQILVKMGKFQMSTLETVT